MSVFRCLDCPRMTRPAGTPESDHPGTVRRQSDRCGLCQACYRRAMKLRGEEPEPRPSLEYTRAGLASFLRRRHGRKETMARREMIAR